MQTTPSDNPDMDRFRAALASVIDGKNLNGDEARQVFELVLRGQVPADTLGALLCALAEKGEQVDELVGAARALRAAATRVRCDRPCLDTCGTGGDGISTFNVSTCAAIIAAAAGAVVAKHGNHTSSRASGSSEVLASLGVNIHASVPVLERCLAELNLAFLHAPDLHPAMRHAAPVRRAIRSRTIFNLLGPLANPAGATRQLLGVSRFEHLDLMARALMQLGAQRAWITHGADGLCDLTITGETTVVEVDAGKTRRFVIRPQDANLTPARLDDLLIGSPDESADTIRAILEGERGPRRDQALLNTAAALVVYGCAESLLDGVRRAASAIDTGAARERLRQICSLTNT